MRVKMPEFIMVTTIDELDKEIRSNRRKNIIVFVDLTPHVWLSDDANRHSEKVRATIYFAKSLYNRKVISNNMFINEKYASKKGLK